MILGSYLREYHAQKSITRDNRHRFILGETIKEKPHNFLRDRMSINGSSKTKRQKYDVQQLFSLSYPSFSLTHVLKLSVSDYVLNREAHSLFILVSDLTITYQSRLL